jgi:hypothetical protein
VAAKSLADDIRHHNGSLGVSEGDELFAIRTPDGIRLTPYDPDFAAAIESTREYMRRHRDALHELAKR